jgi:hypothetical protein
MDVFCDIGWSAMVRAPDQQVPKYCQHPGIPSISGDIAKLDYDLDDDDW